MKTSARVFRAVLGILGTVSCAAILSCSKNKSPEAKLDPISRPQPDEPGGGETPANVNFDIALEEVTADGCLNLPMLSNRLLALPEPTYVRRFTRNFKANDKSVDGSSLRSDFIATLPAHAFEFSDRPIAQYREYVLLAQQNSCKEVTLIDGDQGTKVFKIEKSAPNELVLFDGENDCRTIRWTDSRSVTTSYEYLAQDRCPVWDSRLGKSVWQKVGAARTEVLKWGPAEAISQTQESVAVKMLKAITEVQVAPPADLLAVLQTAQTEESEIMVDTLRLLRGGELKLQYQKCPRDPTKPPEGDDPPNNEEPSAPEEDTGDESGPAPGPTPADGINPTPDQPEEGV